MRLLLGIALCLGALGASGQEAEIQRALIQRDQQSAEFAARLRGGNSAALEQLHARQLLEATARPLHPDPVLARELRPYQREQMAQERTLYLPPPAALAKAAPRPMPEALPLPGGPRHGVDPIPVQGTPY